MELSRQDVDTMINNFYNRPSQDEYQAISNWYENNLNGYPDKEYLNCLYLFLLGANIRHQFREITREEHNGYIREIRSMIEDATPLSRAQRKVYLDYGTKSGRG